MKMSLGRRREREEGPLDTREPSESKAKGLDEGDSVLCTSIAYGIERQPLQRGWRQSVAITELSATTSRATHFK